MMKLTKSQAALLIAVIGAFVLFDLSLYFGYAQKFRSGSSKLMITKSIETDRYLPFDENSGIVKYNSELTLEGELPVLDGAAALFPVYSAFFNAVYPEGSCEFSEGEFSPVSKLQYSNTIGAYKAVADGSADMVFCAAPSEEQKQYAESVGAELEYIPIGREAFVFIVNKNNPVSSLTKDQIRGIYSGEYKNWNKLGGNNENIIPVMRNRGSGSQTAMEAFMGDVPFAGRFEINRLYGSAIGFSFRYYVSDISDSSGVKMLAVDGYEPSLENIQSGDYPIVSEFYAVYRKDNDNPNVAALADWILSPEGQQIVSESGYTPLK